MCYEISIELGLDAAYIRLSRNKPVSTIEISESVNIDLDEFDIIVGIECLELDAKIPFDELMKRFHLHSKDIDMVKSLLPSLTKSKLFAMSEGTSHYPKVDEFEMTHA